MDKERTRLIAKLAVGALGLAACCFIIILCLRACSTPARDSELPTSQPSSSAQDETPGSNQQQVPDPDPGPMSNYTDGEDNSTWGDENKGHYKNERVLVYNYGGGTISLGVEAPNETGALYLNPVCSEASPDTLHQVGFYITASSPALYFSHSTGASPSAAENASYANFIMLDETYDTAAPAAYADAENFGVRWENDPLGINTDNGGATLYIRAVNLNSGRLIAMCRATITYDKTRNTYELTDLKSSDVIDTGEMSAEAKADLAKRAVEFMEAQSIVTPPEGSWNSAQENARVEKVPTPYFPWFIGPKGERLKAYEKPYKNCTIWAVNLPLITGDVTVYFAPYLQAVLGFESSTVPEGGELNLVPIGCARLNPRTAEDIIG